MTTIKISGRVNESVSSVLRPRQHSMVIWIYTK